MQVDETVIFSGVQIAAETAKAILIAVPNLPETNRDHVDLGLAMWVPHSQVLDLQEGTNEDGKRLALTLEIKGWLMQKKVEEWPSIENAELLLFVTSGIERDVVDRINKRLRKRSKF